MIWMPWHSHLLYVRRMYYGIQFPELLSSDWPKNCFVCISDILKYESIKKIFDSVILWLVTYLTQFLYLNIIQSSPNLAQLLICLSGISRYMYIFLISNFYHSPWRDQSVFSPHQKIQNFHSIYIKFGIRVYL